MLMELHHTNVTQEAILYTDLITYRSSGMVQIGVFLAIIYLKGHYGAAVANGELRSQ